MDCKLRRRSNLVMQRAGLGKLTIKFEIRISKSETNSNLQNPNDRNNKELFLR
jgi:hypothetical protein